LNKMSGSVDESHEELKSAVRELCRDYPDKYWRELDEKRAYPEAFVRALTHAGYMATLIPEEYGGAGLVRKHISGSICRRSPTVPFDCKHSE
jgi:alkylation response protein AidB-like acyl-CoA dehydrogenase